MHTRAPFCLGRRIIKDNKSTLIKAFLSSAQWWLVASFPFQCVTHLREGWSREKSKCVLPKLGQRLPHEAHFLRILMCVWWIPPGNRVWSERSLAAAEARKGYARGATLSVRAAAPAVDPAAPAGPSRVTWSKSDHQKAPLRWTRADSLRPPTNSLWLRRWKDAFPYVHFQKKSGTIHRRTTRPTKRHFSVSI